MIRQHEGRITTEDARTAYTCTHTRPHRGSWWRRDGNGLACCPILAVALTEEPTLIDTWHNPHNLREIVGVTQAYFDGFVTGVDGYGKDGNQETLTSAQFLLGYWDGRAVAQDLFDDDRNHAITHRKEPQP